MCGPHWRMVPRALQRDVWLHYRPGQEIDKNPTPAYLDAADAAIRAVAQREDIWGWLGHRARALRTKHVRRILRCKILP